MASTSDGALGDALRQWPATLGEIQTLLAPRFRRREVCARVGRYLKGLLGRADRKNGWQLAEAIKNRV